MRIMIECQEVCIEADKEYVGALRRFNVAIDCRECFREIANNAVGAAIEVLANSTVANEARK